MKTCKVCGHKNCNANLNCHKCKEPFVIKGVKDRRPMLTKKELKAIAAEIDEIKRFKGAWK